MKEVALIIETSNEYARGLLRGIKKYFQKHLNWSIYLFEYGKNHSDLSWLLSWKGDGVLVRVENEQIAEYISKIHLPIVDLSTKRLIPHLPWVDVDHQSIAQMAADHLIERGFREFGFCGNDMYDFSQKRGKHYQAYVENMGFSCSMFDSASLPGRCNIEERKHMAEWIQTLPAPIGIFSCFDIAGRQLLEACKQAGLAVPSEVAVIGVDNDEMRCELSEPSLSSVILNTVDAGYHAAFLLNQLMNGHKLLSETTMTQPKGVHTRQSTDVRATHDKLVTDALQYIRDHACDGICVSDILNHVPLSRRALEHRFRKSLGKTPHEEITAVRLECVKQLLAEETNLTLAEIAEQTGFTHTEYLSVVFKREVGVSPSQYRKSLLKRKKTNVLHAKSHRLHANAIL